MNRPLKVKGIDSKLSIICIDDIIVIDECSEKQYDTAGDHISIETSKYTYRVKETIGSILIRIEKELAK